MAAPDRTSLGGGAADEERAKMPNEEAYGSMTCPAEGCGQKIETVQRWTAGGLNDRGGWVLKCAKCGRVSLVRDF